MNINSKGSNSGIIISIVLMCIIVLVCLFAFNIVSNPFSKNETSNDIAFKDKSIRLQKNKSMQLSLTNNNSKVKYRSSNKSVVTVNENTGYITGINDGVAVITVYIDDKELDKCTIEVYTPVNVINIKSISISPIKLSLYIGESERLKVATLPSNATEKKLYWSTSDSNVATVDNNGNVKAIGVGTAYIRVRTENNVSAKCTVTVSKKATTPTVTKYTLTYNANGGSVSPTSKTLNKGDKYGTLPTPTRSGYTFDGWYTDVSGGTKVDANTVITKNTTIYAHWKKVTTPTTKYTLTYNANGGKVTPTSKTLNKGDKYGALPTPTRSGYKFGGWYTAKSGGTMVDANTVITKNTTIYAHWKVKETNGYSVGPGSETEHYGRTITYKGRTFKHYYQDKINYPYGHGYSITANGCGPVSLAIVLSGYHEIKNKSPQEVADKVGQYGTFTLLINVARSYGMTVEGPRYYNSNDNNLAAVSRLANEANQKLKDGYQIIALVSGNGNCYGCTVANKYSTGNHFIAIIGIANDGQALIMNPLSVKSSEGTMEEIIKWYMPSGGKGLIYLKK